MKFPSHITIIDSHQHAFWHGRDDKGLVADLDAHKIQLAWLLTWEIPPSEDNHSYHGLLNPANFRADGTHAGITLADCVRARDRYPKRFMLGYCPHPAIGNAPALLRAAAQIHGVKICGEWKFRIPFDDPRNLELMRTAGDLKMPVVLHLDVPYLVNAEGKMVYQPMWYGGTVENLERAMQACRDTLFIGHAPGFWREISGDAAQSPDVYPRGPVTPGGKLCALFDKYTNLYADLSAGSALAALRRDPKHAKTFLIRYCDRLLFGRDFYGTELHDFLKTLKLPKRALEKIYFRNALKLVPL